MTDQAALPPEHATASRAGVRLAPPDPGQALLLRPRLLARLQARFRARLTTVVAGPGFGKTSLLAQAVAENRLAPQGRDIWLTCREDDAAASSLAHGLFTAFQLPGASSWEPGVVTDRIVAELWRRSPEQIAIVVDEAHLVPAQSPGGRLLSVLLQELPANGHLVVASRDRLPLATARLAAEGGLVEIGEADLAFTTEEVSDFAELRGVPPTTIKAVGGWPALAELSASTGGERMLDYLWEELLSALPLARRKDLAALCLYAPVDDEIAAALTGHPLDLGSTLAGLPLVSGRPGGERSLHPLWQPALQGLLSVEETNAARRRAAALLERRGEVESAVRLLADAQGWEAIRPIVCETAQRTHPLVAPDVIEQWYGRLPEAERARPEGALMRALVTRAHDLERSRRLFSEAAQRFEESGNLLGETAALTHAAHIAWWLHDMPTLEAAGQHVRDYLAAHPWLRPLAGLGDVLAADAHGDPSTALALLGALEEAPVPASMRPGLDWMWALEWLLAGLPERAKRHAAAAVDAACGTFLAPALDVQVLSHWQAGDIDRALALLPRFEEATVATGRDLGTVFERSQCALMLAFVGALDEAKPHLAVAEAALPGARGAAMAEISFVLGSAAVLVGEGEEDAARALLLTETDKRPLDGDGRTQWHRMFPALTYVLAPSTRPCWEAARLGPLQAFARDLARAVVALRETGDVRLASRLDLSQVGRVRAQLPLPWIVEVAVAAHAAGSPQAVQLLDALGAGQRPWLRRAINAPSSRVARAARALLGQQPATPDHSVEIRVLGPLELSRDGQLVDHPDLRRERVRQLLQYLVVRGPTNRSIVGAELWPDLSPDAAARNLRVTLSYLLRVLEPGKEDGAPSAYVKTEGGAIGLRVGEHLTVDLHRFETELDAAAQAERMASPSTALHHLMLALPWYRADCLTDLAGCDWADLERERIRIRYVTSAVRAGDLLLATGDLETPLRLALDALRVDAFSEDAFGLLVAVRLDRSEIDAARSAYRRLVAMLRELGLPPTRRTQLLARRLEAPRGAMTDSRRARPDSPPRPAQRTDAVASVRRAPSLAAEASWRTRREAVDA